MMMIEDYCKFNLQHIIIGMGFRLQQRYLLSILILSLTLYRVDSIAASNIPDHERRALLDLYSSTEGEHWTWNGESGRWNFTDPSVDPCDAEDRWQGIVCTNSTSSRNVNIISLGSYNLNGTIPVSIGNFSELVVLGLEYNALVGGIPSSVGALRKLRALGLFSNQLSGTIPPSIDDLTDLQFLYLFNNSFVGSIPPLQHLGNLSHLSLNDNALSGTLSDSLGSLLNLRTLLLGRNLLTGTIPSSLSALIGLSYLLLEENQLVGTIPSDFGRLTNLTILSLFSNHLSGSIPSSVCYVKTLQVLAVANNALTGTIPESIGTHDTILQVLAVSDNALTGSIPSSVGLNTMLKVLFLSGNLLSGTIPPSAVGIMSLESVKLDHNCLKGTVPSTLSTLGNLTTLLLQNNQLTGSLSEVFDHWTQRSLGIVQVSDNALTGTYPDELFLLPRLTSFVAVANCFDAELSESICRSYSLQSLVLDGAQSAPSCRRVFIPGLFSSYRSRDDTNGRIPLCVFNMSSLQELHLSGNGYTGSLPSEISPVLVDLSLSHNYLTGTIPHSIQNKQWNDLQISYNLLLGTLVSDFPSNKADSQQQYATISYRNNRLSGRIPSMFQDTFNATIMGGNLFGCLYDRRDVPRHDADQPNTPCGSNEFNISYFIWLTLVIGCMAIGMLLYFQHASVAFIRTKIISWIDVLHIISAEDDSRQWYLFNKVGVALCKLSLHVTLFCLLLLCPLYLIMHLFYATHTYTYAWIVSASYLTGLVPFSLVLIAWISLGLLFVWEATSISAEIKDVYDGIHGRLDDSCHSHSEPEARSGGTDECDTTIQSSLSLSVVQHKAAQGCAKIADDGVGVNDEELLYGSAKKSDAVELANIGSATTDTSGVTADISRIDDQQDPNDASQSSGSSLDGGWRERVVSASLIVSINAVAVVGVNTAYVYIALGSSQTALVLSQLLLSAFKMVWSNKCVPFIIRRVSNWAASYCCYRRTAGGHRDQQLQTLPQFTCLYLLIMLLNNIAIPVMVVSVQSSACFYNFFINSDAVQGYYRYNECQGFDYTPSTEILSCSTYGYSYGQTNINLPYRYSYQCSSSFITYYAPTYVFLCVIIVFVKPVAQLLVEHLRQHPSSIAAPLLSRGGPMVSIRSINDLYDPTVVLVTVLSLVGMSMTFGVVYPPLCPAFLLAILSEWFGAQAALGRHLLSGGITRPQQLVLVRQLLQEYRGVSYFGDLYRACWMLLTASFTFYTLFLFDILDRKVALRHSYPMLVVIPLLPVSWYILHKICVRGPSRRCEEEEAIAGDKEALDSSAHTTTRSSASSSSTTAPSTQKSIVVEMDAIYRDRDSSEKDLLQLVDCRVQRPSRRLGQVNSRDISNGAEIEETLNALRSFHLEQL